jgi:hypothetical protein
MRKSGLERLVKEEAEKIRQINNNTTLFLIIKTPIDLLV